MNGTKIGGVINSMNTVLRFKIHIYLFLFGSFIPRLYLIHSFIDLSSGINRQCSLSPLC